MKYLVWILIVCGFSPNCEPMIAQSLSSPLGWDVLVEHSTIVAVGKVLGRARVIRPDKLYLPAPPPLADGSVLVPTPDPYEYFLGRVVRFRLDEILSKERTLRIKKGDVLYVFIAGWFPKHSDPIFEREGEQLVFLMPTRVEGDETSFVGAVLEDPDQSGKTEPFDPRSSFLVVGGDQGVVPLTAENRQVIRKVKAALRRRKRASRRPMTHTDMAGAKLLNVALPVVFRRPI